MSRFCQAVVILSVFLFAIPGAYAEEKPRRRLSPQIAALLRLGPEGLLRRFDKDKNGALTKSEVPNQLARFLGRGDRNEDGKLDRRELTALFQQLRRSQGNKPGKPNARNNQEVERRTRFVMQRFDKNNDGKIDKKEAEGQIGQNFARIDGNKDGFLDKIEVRRVIAQTVTQQRRQEQELRDNPDFDALDKNADGRLTRQELRGTPFAAQFSAMDADKDGKLKKKEFIVHLKKR